MNDDIELILEIKNIQTLYVNIYEINTENYYYSNKKEFDENISLDGIVPTYEDIFSYNDKPQLLIEKKINISKIPKKKRFICCRVYWKWSCFKSNNSKR